MIQLPIRGPAYDRLPTDVLARLDGVSSATACAKLHAMGIRQTFIEGPRPLRTGQRAIGLARTLQFMPQREDVFSGLGQEHAERSSALWAVVEAAEPADMLVVQASGATHTGCLGEMLLRAFAGRGGAGVVVDGRIRDSARARELDLPVWSTGATPHYASQTELFPWAYDIPIAVGGALVLPGDLVLADDDGAVVVPRQLVPELGEGAQAHEDWESFSRDRIDAGGRLSKYYPLTDEAQKEYQLWRAAANGASDA
jgi:regulator of RNase E activity RraA